MRVLRDIAFRTLSRKKRFERIFDNNSWGSEESVSGNGSTLANTENLRAFLPTLTSEINARSVLDAPSGDFHWMRHALPDCRTVEDYTGIDIVPSITTRNNALYGTPNLRFITGDFTKMNLPTVDLVISRDCLIHLSFSDIRRAIGNFARSGSTYLLTNTYRNVAENHDIVTGRYRFLNLMKSPFSFPDPIKFAVENQEGKLIALWRISDLIQRPS